MPVTTYVKGAIFVYSTNDLVKLLDKAAQQQRGTKIVLRLAIPASPHRMQSISDSFNEDFCPHVWPMGVVDHESLGFDNDGYYAYGFHVRERGIIDL